MQSWGCMKKIIIGGAVLLSITLCIGAIFIITLSQSEESKQSLEDRALEVIVRDLPAFASNGKPAIRVGSISPHGNGWYIATIEPLRPVKNPVPVRIILSDKDGWIRIVAGPEAYFSESELLSFNLPDSAILELQKS